jgi:hypothetical protein
MKLNVKSFALTCGLFLGFGILFLTLWYILFEGANGHVTFIGKIYRGYNISLSGGLIGLVWGFFDGLISGFIFAWLYNLLAGKLKVTEN